MFQFQSGAIQRSIGFEGTGGYTVSIPKWCDSKFKLDYCGKLAVNMFQFQSGAIQSVLST